jgi:hypothetical protein
MSFQAYLDTIKSKTGLGPAEFRAAAQEKGLLGDGVKTGDIVAWLAEDYGLGRGHAMALVATFKPVAGSQQNPAEVIDKHFAGGKAHWREHYDALLETVSAFGPVTLAPTNTYISLFKGRAKFAIVAVTAARLDIGIKLVDVAATERLQPSGSWNSMVTHRVRITDPAQIDAELIAWLKSAYAAA